jgi:hypothetical protein
VVLTFLAFVFVREPAVVYLIHILAAFRSGLGRTVMTASVSLAAEADRCGEAMGVQGTVSSALTAGGLLLAGWIFVSVSPSGPFAIIACFAATAFVATATYMVQNRYKAAEGITEPPRSC